MPQGDPTVMLSVRLTESQMAELEARSRKAKMNRSDFVRSRVLGPPPRKDTGERQERKPRKRTRPQTHARKCRMCGAMEARLIPPKAGARDGGPGEGEGEMYCSACRALYDVVVVR